MHIDDVERHDCAVNSSELAGHARAEQRSKHTCFSLTVRTPECANTVLGTTNTQQEQTITKRAKLHKNSKIFDQSGEVGPHA